MFLHGLFRHPLIKIEFDFRDDDEWYDTFFLPRPRAEKGLDIRPFASERTECMYRV
jgi:hypothetical protein